MCLRTSSVTTSAAADGAMPTQTSVNIADVLPTPRFDGRIDNLNRPRSKLGAPLQALLPGHLGDYKWMRQESRCRDLKSKDRGPRSRIYSDLHSEDADCV